MPSVTPPFRLSVPTDGVRADLAPQDVPPTALRDSQNWIYRDGIFRGRAGFTAFGNDVNERPMAFADYVHNDGARRLVMGTRVGWRKYNTGAGTWDSITGTLTGAAGDQIVFRVFDRGGTKYLLGINGADTLKKWDGAAAGFSAAGGSPPRARTMVIANDRIVLFNLLSGPTISGSAYDVSASKDFDAGWGVTLSGILVDTPGSIVAALEFGPLQSAIYKEDAIYMMFAQAPTIAPFRFELKSAAVAGPVSPLAAVQVSDGLHAFLGLDGAVRLFDGVETRSIGYHAQKYIASRLDPALAGRSFGFFDREQNDLVFAFPEFGSTEPNVFVHLNVGSGSFWPQRFPATIRASAGLKVTATTSVTLGDLPGNIGDYDKTLGEFDAPLRNVIFGETGGQVYTNSGVTDAGAGIETYFETGLLGEGPEWKTLIEIEHLLKPQGAAASASLQIGVAVSNEDRVLGSAVAIPHGAIAPPFHTGHRVSARRFSYRLSTASSPTTPEWAGAVAHFAGRGPR